MSANKIQRRQFLSAGTAGMALAGCSSLPTRNNSERSEKPNILMITCHDIGQHLGCYGIKSVRSPNLDRLAASGVRIQNYYGGDPVCSPSRGVMLTGRYPQSNGLMGLTHAPWWWSLNPREKHLAEILRDSGYRTILAGLQHVTQKDPHTLGYDEVLSKRKDANETVEAVQKVFANAEKKTKPFFLKAGFFEVHRRSGSYKHREPDTTKGVHIPPYLKDTPEIRDDLARFQSDIHFLDKCVGEMLRSLEESSFADDTLVIFTSDHGIAYPGAKWCLRESGIRIPCILNWPGTPLSGGKVFEDLMGHVDFLPTLLDLAGLDIPENVQGKSFRNLLLGKTKKGPRRYVFAHRQSHARRENTARSVRDDRFKLVRCFENDRTVQYPTSAVPEKVSQHTGRPKRKGARPFAELYDLKKDPNEFHDLSGNSAYADVVKRLSKALYDWMEDVDDPLLKGAVATPYYRRAISDLQKYRSG